MFNAESYILKVVAGFPRDSQCEISVNSDDEMFLNHDGTEYELGYASNSIEAPEFLVLSFQLPLTGVEGDIQKLAQWVLGTRPIFGALRFMNSSDGAFAALYADCVLNLQTVEEDTRIATAAFMALNWSHFNLAEEFPQFVS